MLQRIAYSKVPSLEDFALSNVASVDTLPSLQTHLTPCTYGNVMHLQYYQVIRVMCRWDELHTLGSGVCVVGDEDPDHMPHSLLLNVLIAHAQRRLPQTDALNTMPLYPTEQVCAGPCVCVRLTSMCMTCTVTDDVDGQ